MADIQVGILVEHGSLIRSAVCCAFFTCRVLVIPAIYFEYLFNMLVVSGSVVSARRDVQRFIRSSDFRVIPSCPPLEGAASYDFDHPWPSFDTDILCPYSR